VGKWDIKDIWKASHYLIEKYKPIKRKIDEAERELRQVSPGRPVPKYIFR